jgi:hypothetical protein
LGIIFVLELEIVYCLDTCIMQGIGDLDTNENVKTVIE